MIDKDFIEACVFGFFVGIASVIITSLIVFLCWLVFLIFTWIF